MECSHEGILINELVGIYTSSLLPRTQLAAAHALYLALDRCRDMVHVTNDKNIIQVLNNILISNPYILYSHFQYFLLKKNYIFYCTYEYSSSVIF